MVTALLATTSKTNLMPSEIFPQDYPVRKVHNGFQTYQRWDVISLFISNCLSTHENSRTTVHGATRRWFDGGGPLWNHRTCDNGFLTTQSLDVHSNRRLVIYGGTCQYVTSRKRHARCDQMRSVLTTLHTVYSAHSISSARLSVWYSYVAAALKTKSSIPVYA